ncbi:hypothetical protein INT47_002742 [Mucor saturninus]|uniref:Uncharacterized protein n=1 Tax=Mucor saturninus TaxID=64648 RepID=A0A8H7QS60_9FUNG|nr:hypothetical protein INT47_002742 [Mucor saturninus]
MNHSISNSSNTTTTINTSLLTNNHINPLKRKRTMKSVQFSSKVTVLETYSAEEYDRSDIFAAPTLYTINPNVIRSTPQLSLNIENCAPNLVKDEDQGSGEISSADVSPNTPPGNTADEYFMSSIMTKKKKQRPILSVNTTMCADPLFFTRLTTNYKNDTTTPDTKNDFLVPISATVTL